MITADLISRLMAWGMIAVWIVVGVLFQVMHPRNVAKEVRRAARWWIGLVIQVVAVLIALIFSRPFATPHHHVPLWLQIALALSAFLIAVASAWLILGAVKSLGKQFGVAARIVTGHQLVRTGPFAVVRHPIYSGFLGLLIATALAYSTWLGFIFSVALYLFGTTMRIRKEETLLRETFGAEYEAYANEVPALVPGLM
jgi:protein-S-isoprenylcysteine O-methyltransferase Ste14